MLVILGGVDMDLLDLDLDVDMDLDFDAEPSFTDWGMVGLKWFNLGDVPLMLWLSALALSSFMITALVDQEMPDATNGELAIVILRNLALGSLAAKILTQPLKGKLKFVEPNTVRDLLGRSCTVVSQTVTESQGIAECTTEDGAPLRLNVRMLEGAAQKNSLVEIIDYSEETGIYHVRPKQEN